MTWLFAAPRQTAVGEAIVLEAEATDPDGDDPWFLWEGDGGTLEDAKQAKASYVCDEQGKHMITLSFGDSRGCAAELTFSVRCGS